VAGAERKETAERANTTPLRELTLK
jgi:hypothetical protein